MAAGDDYRIKAADVHAKAKGESSLRTRAELESLALAYLRLADQAERNAGFQSSMDRSAVPVRQQQQQQQQQQQPQSKKDRGEDTQ